MVPQSTVHILYKQCATDNITVVSLVSLGYRVVYYGLGTNILGAHTSNFHVQQLERKYPQPESSLTWRFSMARLPQYCSKMQFYIWVTIF